MRITRTIAIATLLAGAVPMIQSATAADSPRDPVNPMETAAAKLDGRRTMPPATATAPAAAETPAARAEEAEDNVSGSEPDPETFDRQGLETWWLGHLRRNQ
jgi:hypothetical protein